MKRNYIREKKIYCGENYLEVDIISRIENKIKPGKRSKKEKVSAPKQKRLNDKNARRYFTQLINSNFDKKDIHITLTYNDKHLPKSLEDANREATNFIRRISYRRKKRNLHPLKYILVTEHGKNIKEKKVRIHHHLIVNNGLSRDEIEDLWRRPRKKGQKKGDKLGYVNADRLQPNEYGLKDLSGYLIKNPSGQKRWSSSQNLIKPWSRTNDHKYTKRQIEKIIKEDPKREYWEKKYPGWILTEINPVYTLFTGWSIYLKLRKIRR